MRHAKLSIASVGLAVLLTVCSSGNGTGTLPQGGSAGRSVADTGGAPDNAGANGGATGGNGVGISSDGPRPPHHVIVTQGPTDPTALYALVTWDRSDPSADAYEVLRDGNLIGTVSVQGDPWDDTVYRDSSVAPGDHRYSVRAVAGGKGGGASVPFKIRIRSDADFGALYVVDSFTGTDSEKIAAAIKAATDAGGGVVQFAARTYQLSWSGDEPGVIIVRGDRIVLRGAGIDKTILQAGFPGLAGDNACGGWDLPRMVYFDDRLADLTTKLAAPIAPGDRTVQVADASGLEAGQVVLLSETHDETEWDVFHAKGVTQDPGTGHDDRYPYEANEIVEIKGNSVTFKYPFSYGFSTSVPWKLVASCRHNGIERLTIQGRSEDEQTWYDGVWLQGADNYAADIKVQWNNRRVAEVNGYNIRLVGIQGGYTGPKGYIDGICRYKIQVYQATNGLIVGATMGSSTDDRAMSLVTIQQAVRIVVRNSVFHQSRSYAVNEHGEGSRHLLVENNYFATGPASSYAIDLGNNTWGFSGPMIIRNNTFENNQRDIGVDENSYEVRILDNISRGNKLEFLRAFAWAGPDTAPDLHGSMRMTVARNRVSGAMGLYLGPDDGVYPFLGMRDVAIYENRFDVVEEAIQFFGDSDHTKRIQVWNNTGKATYIKPELVAGDYWSGNADGKSFGAKTDVPWTVETFDWEQYDRD